MPTAIRRTPKPRAPERSALQTQGDFAAVGAIDLKNYAPAYITWIANKLNSGASQAYRASFDIGIEIWRLLVLLAIDRSMTAQQICKVIGMDKGSASRALKDMEARGLITVAVDPDDGRMRVATITAKGRQLHDRIVAVALERERAFFAVLSAQERALFMDMLRRLHDNLGAVEEATAACLPQQRARHARQTPRG